MDRPLSMTELQTIRAALEAADNYAALVEYTNQRRDDESLAVLVEAVHRALAVVDRRIHALNQRAVERVAGAEPTAVDLEALKAFRATLLAQGPFGRSDQSNGAQPCTCGAAHSEDCGAHGFSTLALRKRYGYACPHCTMPASHSEPVHKCKRCGRTQDGPG